MTERSTEDKSPVELFPRLFPLRPQIPPQGPTQERSKASSFQSCLNTFGGIHLASPDTNHRQTWEALFNSQKTQSENLLTCPAYSGYQGNSSSRPS